MKIHQEIYDIEPTYTPGARVLSRGELLEIYTYLNKKWDTPIPAWLLEAKDEQVD